MSTSLHTKRIAQHIMRDMLDQGVTPNGNLQQVDQQLPLLTAIVSVVDKVKTAAREAARHEVSKLNSPALMELISSELDEVGVGTLLSDVIETNIEWLWQDRIALGKIATLDGDPGLGKSTMMFDLAARVSKGRPMPDGTRGVKGGVVLICLEDGLSDTIRPRLNRMGADLSKILSIGFMDTTDPTTQHVYERPFTLPDDLFILEQSIERVNAKLIIIDPVTAILGGKSSAKEEEVRMLLMPIKAIAEKYGTAVVMLRHLNKGGGDHALYRGMGSIAFVGLARTGLLVTPKPEIEGECVLSNIKNNLSQHASGLTYAVVSDKEEGDNRAYIKWGEVDHHSVYELISNQKPSKGRQDIVRVLREAYPAPMEPKSIAELADMPDVTVRVNLTRMLKDGQVMQPARGLYTLPTAPEMS